MKHMSLKELVAGQRITGYYILQSGKAGTTSEGAPYYCATMLDGSGTMDLRCWQNANNLVEKKTIGEVIYLEGDVKLYRETQQICCQLLRPANGKDAGEYELSQLLPTAKEHARGCSALYRADGLGGWAVPACLSTEASRRLSCT